MPYEYDAKLLYVIDGDTMDMSVSLGFRLTTTQRLRLCGCNTPEVRGPERRIGVACRDYIGVLLESEPIWTIRTYKSDSFGRWLVDIFMPQPLDPLDPATLSDLLIDYGYALPWDGTGKRPAFDLSRPYPDP